MEKTNFCIFLFLVFLASLCNSNDYNYDDYNYDQNYDYNNQNPEDYTDDYSQELNEYYDQNLLAPPNLPAPLPMLPPPPPPPMECKNYKSLTDSTRKLDNPATGYNWKTDHFNDSRVIKSGVSVDWQGEAWYRVMGDAGTRIPEDPFTSVQVGYRYCKTFCPGYLPSGSHPQTPGELVTNVKVCYNCLFFGPRVKTLCNYSNNYVKIRHCGDYFVYYLTEPLTRYLNSRYCTE